MSYFFSVGPTNLPYQLSVHQSEAVNILKMKLQRMKGNVEGVIKREVTKCNDTGPKSVTPLATDEKLNIYILKT